MRKFTVEAGFPSLPNTPPPVLSLEAPEVSESSLRALAREFGLRGSETEIRRHSTAISYSEGSVLVQHFLGSGGLRRREIGSWMRSERDSSFEITDLNAVEAAREAIRDFGFLREAAGEAGVAVVKRLNQASSKPNSESFSQRVTHAAVSFQRSISNVPVEGPGGKLNVFLSPERKLTGVDFLWRRISGVHSETKRLRSAEEAVRQVTDTWEERGVPSGVVNQVRFGYLELGWSDEQALMQPAYIVFGVLGGSEDTARSGVVEVVHASADPVGTLVPPLPRVPRQPARAR